MHWESELECQMPVPPEEPLAHILLQWVILGIRAVVMQAEIDCCSDRRSRKIPDI